uniref:androgen-induced gene 1 protein isoform 8 n=1 Tax=Mus musculus TaxID=10090 RepID=UPI00313451F7
MFLGTFIALFCAQVRDHIQNFYRLPTANVGMPFPLAQVFAKFYKVIQAVFFGICVLTDLSSLLTRGSGNQEQERQLRKLISLRDWTLAVLAFPVGVFVVAVFWTIYAYDREMIYPRLLDNFIPGWLNHGMVSALR